MTCDCEYPGGRSAECGPGGQQGCGTCQCACHRPAKPCPACAEKDAEIEKWKANDAASTRAIEDTTIAWNTALRRAEAAEAALVAVRQEREEMKQRIFDLETRLYEPPAAPAPSAAETVTYQGRTEPQAQFRHGAVDDPHEETPR